MHYHFRKASFKHHIIADVFVFEPGEKGEREREKDNETKNQVRGFADYYQPTRITSVLCVRIDHF